MLLFQNALSPPFIGVEKKDVFCAVLVRQHQILVQLLARLKIRRLRIRPRDYSAPVFSMHVCSAPTLCYIKLSAVVPAEFREDRVVSSLIVEPVKRVV